VRVPAAGSAEREHVLAAAPGTDERDRTPERVLHELDIGARTFG
jgi:hypothetical protein